MSTGITYIKPLKQTQFLKFAYLFLGVAFLFMMIQNVIRYGAHDSYDPLNALFYLVNSMVLFVPLIPLLIWIARHYIPKSVQVYVPLGGLAIIVSIVFFYLYSSLSLFLFNYYEEILHPTYARNYFSREALLHIMVLVAALVFVWYNREEKTSPQMISGSLGRKKISLALAQIEWIESDDHYLKLYSEEMTLVKRATMKQMEEQLSPVFVRIHRKYMVNKSEIVGLMKEKRATYLILKSSKKLKVGNSYLSVLDELPVHDK